MNLGELTPLIEIVKLKILRDQKGSWSKGSQTYLDALFDEVEEVKKELVSGRQCFLEDELGDMLWVYLCFIRNLEAEGKISMDAVFNRSIKKYEERVNGINNGESWSDIKVRQKLKLKKEQLSFNIQK